MLKGPVRRFPVLLLFTVLALQSRAQQADPGHQPIDTCSTIIGAIEIGLFMSVPLDDGLDAAIRYLSTLPGFGHKVGMGFDENGNRLYQFVAQQAFRDSIPLLDDKSMVFISYLTDSLQKKSLHQVVANYCFIRPADGAAVFAAMLKILDELQLPFVYRTNVANQKYRLYALGCKHSLSIRYGTDNIQSYSIIDVRYSRDNP
jgi:hypothetical protein